MAQPQAQHETVPQQTIVPAFLSVLYSLFCVYGASDVGYLHYVRTLMYVSSWYMARVVSPPRPLSMAAQQLIGLLLCTAELALNVSHTVDGGNLAHDASRADVLWYAHRHSVECGLLVVTLVGSVSLVLHFMRHGLEKVFLPDKVN